MTLVRLSLALLLFGLAACSKPSGEATGETEPPQLEYMSALPEEFRSLALERELVVTDIGVYPNLNTEQCEQIYNEIAVALLDFMFERPAAKDVLRGRTFARTLH